MTGVLCFPAVHTVRRRRGRSYREIGLDLNISYHTVKSHVERIYAKAEVNNRAQLLYALGAPDPPDPYPAAK